MTRAYSRRINKDRRQVPLSSFDQHGILCTLQCRFLAVLQFSICLSVRSFLNIVAVCSRTSILEELGIQVFSPCSILLSGDYHNSLLSLPIYIIQSERHCTYDMINSFGQSPFTFSSSQARSICARWATQSLYTLHPFSFIQLFRGREDSVFLG